MKATSAKALLCALETSRFALEKLREQMTLDPSLVCQEATGKTIYNLSKVSLECERIQVEREKTEALERIAALRGAESKDDEPSSTSAHAQSFQDLVRAAKAMLPNGGAE